MTEAGTGAADARRKHGAPKNWRDVFIATLGETSSVEASAGAAGIRTAWAYKTRREDADFARRWFEALCEGYDNLEMDLLYRLRSGRIEEVDEDGSKRKFDLATAFRILTAHRERATGEAGSAQGEDEQAVLDSINAKIDAMRAREKEVTDLLARDGIIQPRA